MRGGPERFGDVVRRVVELAPDAEVLVRADAMASLEPGSTVVVYLRRQDFDWLNMARPVVRGHRVVLFGDPETALALEQTSFDFFDWISHRIEAPAGPPAFAVRALRSAACARANVVVWKGGDLDGTFADALPGRRLVRVSAAQPYGDLVGAMRPKPRTWVAVTDLGEGFRVQRARWAAAEAGRYGRTILVESTLAITGALAAHAQPSNVETAAEQLAAAGIVHGARIAALLDLKPEAIQLAGTMAKTGASETQIEKAAADLVRSPTPPNEPTPRRLPDRVARVRMAMEEGDDVVAGRWATQWRTETRGGVEATAALARICALGSRLQEANRWIGELESVPDETLTERERFEVLRAKVVFASASGSWSQTILQSERALTLARRANAEVDEQEEILGAKVVALAFLGKLKEATRTMKEWSALDGGEPPSGAHLVAAAGLTLAKGDAHSAAALLESVLLGAGSGNHEGRSTLERMLGEAWIAVGRHAEAERLLGAAIDRAKQLGQPTSKLLHEHARSLFELGRFAEAEGEFRLVLAQSSSEETALGTKQELARSLSVQGRLDEAEVLIDEVLEALRRVGVAQTPRFVMALYEKARIRSLRGSPEESANLLREVLTVEEDALGKHHPTLVHTLSALGDALVQNHQAREAEPILRRAQRLAEQAGDRVGLAVALGNLAVAQSVRGVSHAADTARNALRAWSDAGSEPARTIAATLELIAAGRMAGPVRSALTTKRARGPMERK